MGKNRRTRHRVCMAPDAAGLKSGRYRSAAICFADGLAIAPSYCAKRAAMPSSPWVLKRDTICTRS
jgi:hypothetical protein